MLARDIRWGDFPGVSFRSERSIMRMIYAMEKVRPPVTLEYIEKIGPTRWRRYPGIGDVAVRDIKIVIDALRKDNVEKLMKVAQNGLQVCVYEDGITIDWFDYETAFLMIKPFMSDHEQCCATARFISAFNPKAVLDLIKENVS